MPSTPGATAADTIADRFARHAAAIETTSPLYAGLMRHVAHDVLAGGPSWLVVRDFGGERPRQALTLRLMAAVHRIVLRGEAPELAAWYPTAGGTADPERAWPAFRALLAERRQDICAVVRGRMQTNEVGRCAALLWGFAALSAGAGMPLRLFELGSSAGLNLVWDRYGYAVGRRRLGPADAGLVLDVPVRGPAPALPKRWPEVVARRGCDPNPLDPCDEDDRLTLRSAIWADDPARMAQLDGALEEAGRRPAQVDRAEAGRWLAEVLDVEAGAATVVFHSIVWQYLDDAERDRVHGALEAAAARARPGAPLAWLTLEPPRERFRRGDPRGDLAELRLTTWPDGGERLVARCGYHGRPVVFAAGDDLNA